MQKQITAPIVILIVFIFASVGGVFFIIYNHQPIAEVAVENKPLVEETVVYGEEKPSELETIASELEKVAKESEELAAKVQQFLLEEQEKKNAQEKSSMVKGIYIGSSRNPDRFKELLAGTELNGLVVDIKEVSGQNLTPSVKTLISEFHKSDDWLIARIVVFRDSSLLQTNPDWYLMSTTSASTPPFFQDGANQYWLDPQNQEVRNYIVEFSKKAIDYGFDELQFDYIRYPDDYKMISGPEKIKIIGDFFSELSEALRSYKPSIILSADLFGYLATQFQSFDIGQRLSDAGKCFDYLSFMLYPSHFYGGFSADYDAKRELPALNFPYEAVDITQVTPNNPYPVILRSVLASLDYLSLYGFSAKVRPWLQDFNLSYDVNRGIIYDAEKIKVQIQGAEDAGSAGWLLWNSANIYTKDAFPKVGE